MKLYINANKFIMQSSSPYVKAQPTLDNIRESFSEALLSDHLEFEHLETYTWTSSCAENPVDNSVLMVFKLNIKFKINEFTTYRFSPFELHVKIDRESLSNLIHFSDEESANFYQDFKRKCVDKVNEWKSEHIQNNKLKFTWNVKFKCNDYEDFDSFSDISYEGAKNRMESRARQKNKFLRKEDMEFRINPSNYPYKYELPIILRYTQKTLF